MRSHSRVTHKHGSMRRSLQRRTVCSTCRAATLEQNGSVAAQEAVYTWEQLELPSLTEGNKVFQEETRIRSHEVGVNRQSTMISVSNMLQVRASCR